MTQDKHDAIRSLLRDAATHAMRDAISEGLPPVGLAVLTKSGRVVVAGPISYGSAGSKAGFETAEQVLDTALRAIFAHNGQMPSLETVLQASFRAEADIEDPFSLEKRVEKFFFSPS